MSRVVKLLRGSGAGGTWVPDTDLATEVIVWTPMQDDIELALLGAFQRNIFAGWGEFDASSAGTFDLPLWLPIGWDNSGSQLSGFSDAFGAVLVAQFRFLVLVSNSLISATPKVFDITAAALATTSGAAACTATGVDFSGVDQQQVLAVTLPTALHYFKPQITIAGTPAAGYRCRAAAIADLYVSS